jgi:hypothetical protein
VRTLAFAFRAWAGGGSAAHGFAGLGTRLPTVSQCGCGGTHLVQLRTTVFKFSAGEKPLRSVRPADRRVPADHCAA